MLCGRTHTILRAGTLFDSVTRAAYDFAERGVSFIDRIKRPRNLADWETIPLDRRVPAARSAIAALRAPLGSINRRGRSAPLTLQASLDEVELADLLAVAIPPWKTRLKPRALRPRRSIRVGMTGLCYGGSIGLGRGLGPPNQPGGLPDLCSLSPGEGRIPPVRPGCLFLNETVAGLDEGRASPDRHTCHPQRAAYLRGADRHPRAGRGQRFQRREPLFALARTRKVLQPAGHGWRKKCPATRRGASRRPA